MLTLCRDQMTFIEISSLSGIVAEAIHELFANFAAHRTYLNSNCDTCGEWGVDSSRLSYHHQVIEEAEHTK